MSACQGSSVVTLDPYEGGLEPPKKIRHKTTWKQPNLMDFFGPQKWSRYITLEFQANENPPCDLLLHQQLSSLLHTQEPHFSVENNKITVRVASEAQSELLLSTNKLCSKEVSPKVEEKFNTRVGTMLLDRLGIGDESNEVLCKCIKEILMSQNHNVSHVYIYERWSSRIKRNIKIAKVTFNQQSIPKFMKVGVKRISIQEELPKPMQCKICLKFGHTSNRCINKSNPEYNRCFKCGTQKHDDDCDLTACFNCGGPHHAFSRECPHFKYHQEALLRSYRHGISLRDAKSDMKDDGIVLNVLTYAGKVGQDSTTKSKPEMRSTSKEKPDEDVSVQNRFAVLERNDMDTAESEEPASTIPHSSSIRSSSSPNKNPIPVSVTRTKAPDIELQLKQLDGPSESSKRPYEHNTSDEKDSEEEPPSMKKCQTEPDSSQETILFETVQNQSPETTTISKPCDLPQIGESVRIAFSGLQTLTRAPLCCSIFTEASVRRDYQNLT